MNDTSKAVELSSLAPKTIKLLGPRYSLLQNDYSNLRQFCNSGKGEVQNILIYFGKSDLHSFTEMAVESCISLNLSEVDIHVVLSEQNQSYSKIKQLEKKYRHIHLYSHQSSLAQLLVNMDLCIGAAGASSWERCCFGIFSVVVSLADNQISIAQNLHDKKFAYWLAHFDKVTPEIMIKGIKNCIETRDLNSKSREMMDLVDGIGVARVISAMTTGEDTKFIARWIKSSDLSGAHVFVEITASGNLNGNLNLEEIRSKITEPARFRIVILETPDQSICGMAIFNFQDKGIKLDTYVVPELSKALSFSVISKHALMFFQKNSSSNFWYQKIDNISISDEFPLGLEAAPLCCARHLRVAICSGQSNWMNDYIAGMIIKWIKFGIDVLWVHDLRDNVQADVCILLGFEEILSAQALNQFSNCVVVHASDLPEGRGWSPATWQILNGDNRLPMSLIEASAQVDSGSIYDQAFVEIERTDLVDEWREKLAICTSTLLDKFILNYPASTLNARPQQGSPSYYRRRTREDSRIDIDKSIRSQLELFQVADNEKYPVFYEFGGFKFELRISKEK